MICSPVFAQSRYTEDLYQMAEKGEPTARSLGSIPDVDLLVHSFDTL